MSRGQRSPAADDRALRRRSGRGAARFRASWLSGAVMVMSEVCRPRRRVPPPWNEHDALGKTIAAANTPRGPKSAASTPTAGPRRCRPAAGPSGRASESGRSPRRCAVGTIVASMAYPASDARAPRADLTESTSCSLGRGQAQRVLLEVEEGDACGDARSIAEIRKQNGQIGPAESADPPSKRGHKVSHRNIEVVARSG